jgi:hypothetical protein
LYLNAEPSSTGTSFRQRALADRAFERRLGDLLHAAVHEEREHLVVEVARRLDEPQARRLHRLALFRGDRQYGELATLGAVLEDVGATTDEVDDALMLLRLAEGELHGDGVRAQALADGGHVHREVGADLVHLVDEREARHAIAIGLSPHGLRLGLHAVAGVEHRHRAVEHSEGALHFDGEVDVSGRVDEVELVALALVRSGQRRPERRRRRGGDGDAALLLLGEEVERGGAVVHLAGAMDAAGEEEDAFGHGGLAGVDMSHDAEVAGEGERKGASHLRLRVSIRRAYLSRLGGEGPTMRYG